MTDKPALAEDEYFAKLEFDRKKKLEEEARQTVAEDEKKRLQELHHMSCPKCGMGLIEIDYKKIRIDKCSNCGGIWLDEGELEEILGDETGRFNGFLKLFKG